MFCVYVLENKDEKHYIGSSAYLVDRLKMHNDTSLQKVRFHRTTFNRGPWKVIFSKQFLTRAEALRFEKYLKTGAGRDWLERGRRGD